MRAYAASSPSVVTPLNRYIGYENAAKVAKQALADGATIRETVIAMGFVERGELTEEQLDEALDLASMTHPVGASGAACCARLGGSQARRRSRRPVRRAVAPTCRIIAVTSATAMSGSGPCESAARRRPSVAEQLVPAPCWPSAGRSR